MHVDIKRPHVNDFSSWLKLRRELWPNHREEDLASELRNIYQDINHTPIFIAYVDDAVVGFIELSIHHDVPWCLTTPVGYIEGWYVKPPYRKKGIGKKLVDAGEAWAKALGCLEMASDTTEDYTISTRAHLACGYEEVIPMHFRKKL